MEQDTESVLLRRFVGVKASEFINLTISHTCIDQPKFQIWLLSNTQRDIWTCKREEEKRIRNRRFDWSVKAAYLPVCEAQAFEFVDPLDGLGGSQKNELLVRVTLAGRAGQDLRIDAVRRVPVCHICQHIARQRPKCEQCGMVERAPRHMFPYTTIVDPISAHNWPADPSHGSTTTVLPFALMGAVRHVVLLAKGVKVSAARRCYKHEVI